MEDVMIMNEALPDFVGFIFAKSRRQINRRQASELKKMLDVRIKAVGVFVNNSISEIAELCNEGIIDVVQLHGDEDETYIAALKTFIQNPVIKAVRVREHADIKKQFKCEFMLYDAYSESAYGGTGESFNWNFISEAKGPFFLAGGLNLENVCEAIAKTSPYCVDLSSGVETGGFKDRDKVLLVVSAVRNTI